MSVILDALRRARRGQDVRPGRPLPTRALHATARLPAGLGLGTTPPVSTRPTRTRSVAIAAMLVIALGAWAALQVASRVGVPDGRPAPPTNPVATARPPAAPAPVSPRATTPAPAPQPVAPADPIPSASLGTAASPPTPRPRSAAAAPVTVNQFEQGVKDHTAGNLDEAAKHYLAAIADNDRHLEARNNLGLLYRSRGETAPAIEQFRRALAIDPRYVTARNHLAVLLIDAGRFADARRAVDEGLALDPRNVDLLVNLALVEKGERHDERAMELLLRAVGDRPAHAAAHYNLAVLYDERHSFALAYDHYIDFLAYAGSEYRTTIPDVRRRVQTLATLLDATTTH